MVNRGHDPGSSLSRCSQQTWNPCQDVQIHYKMLRLPATSWLHREYSPQPYDKRTLRWWQSKKVLVKPDEDCTLDGIEKFVMGEESGKYSLADTKAANAVAGISSYRKQQKFGTQTQGQEGEKPICYSCGSTTHKLGDRKKYCSAFNTKCDKCQKLGHFSPGRLKLIWCLWAVFYGEIVPAKMHEFCHFSCVLKDN